MARTALTVIELAGSKHPARCTPFVAAAADVANGNEWALKEGDLLLAVNNGVTPRVLTLGATADAQGRAINAAPTIGASEFWVCGGFRRLGWAQSDGMMYVDGAHADLLLAPLRRAKS